MKKRCLAVLLAACVTVGSVLMPTEGAAVYAANETEEVLLQEDSETAESSSESQGGETADGMETVSTEPENAEIPSDITETVSTETESTENVSTDSEKTESIEKENAGTTETAGDVTENSGTEAAESGETEKIEPETEEIIEETEFRETELEEETEIKETELKFPTGGLIQKEISSTFAVEDISLYENQSVEEWKGSAIYNAEWDKYSNNYFYNQLSDTERKFWDALDAKCLEYLTTNKSIQYNSSYEGYEGYYTDGVAASGLSPYGALNVFRMFRFSNPQYYFLNIGVLPLMYGDSVLVLGLEVYPAFADGSARAKATEAVKNQVNDWQNQIDTCANDEQKVKLIHDLIIQKVEYNYDIEKFPNTSEGQEALLQWEETAYSQSAYSVFCTDLTVCAGYSQAFEMMCNGSGIDAVAVTSSDHEWNKVRINDSWYNMDCTWDDQEGKVFYEFFARNDAYYDSIGYHTEEEYWQPYLPPCTLDSTSSGWTAGVFPTITQTAEAPKISVQTDSEGDCEVTITAASANTAIYYTLDGTTPEESAAKSYRYSDSFYVDGSVTVNAIAVCDGCWDSAVTSKSIKPSKKITITYNGNGATSGSMSKQNGYTNSTVTLKKNTFKKTGYTFAGWNTKKNGKGTSYSDKQKVSNLTGSITLYAQWEVPTYKITYKLDGGKNNKNNPSTYKKTTKTITLKNPTKTGYTFKGWYSDKKFKNKVTSIKKGSTGNKTLYAKWEANKYTIKFNGNGSTSGKMSSLTSCKYGKNYKLTANKFKKKGYTFVGWNTKKNGSGKTYKNKQSIKNLTSKNGGTVTLYAQWKKK